MFFANRGSCAFTAALTGFETVPSFAISCASAGAFACGAFAAGVVCCPKALPAASIHATTIHPNRFPAIFLLLELRTKAYSPLPQPTTFFHGAAKWPL
jgi:hypothetical protein